jgi:hypothetical protein
VIRPAWLRLFLHRRGWIASPSLAWLGVPFGPDRRDLAGEVLTAVAAATANDPCPVCEPGETCPFGWPTRTAEPS